MKKVILSIALLVGLGSVQNSNAQTISMGVKAEANTSSFLLTDLPNLESNMGFGASVGGFMKVDLSENFAIQPEVMFHFKNSQQKIKSTGIKTDYQYFGAEIPVYALGQCSLGDGRFYGGVGPYVGFGFDAKNKNNGIKIDQYKNDLMKRFDFGAGAMLGYEFSNRMQINASYKMGLINTLDKGSNDSKMRNQTISLGLGYRF